MLLIVIIILSLILYLARKFGFLDIIQSVLLVVISILLGIIAFGTFCPSTLRHYIFFQMNLNEVLAGMPSEIMDSEKIKAMSNVNKTNLGETLSNLTNNLLDVLSQKPVDNSIHLENQTKLLSSIDQKLTDANTISEVQLEQYANGQNVALQKLSSINNGIDVQTKKLQIAINQPLGVMDSLNSINSNVKPTIKMLGELNELNYKVGQENKILVEGFNKLLQSDGNANLGKELHNLSASLDNKLAIHQEDYIKTLQNLNEQYALDRMETKNLLEQVQISSLADIELAREEAERKIEAAEHMANYYRKHESLGQNTYNSGVTIPKVGNESDINKAAAGIGTATMLTWVLKFLRIV